MAWSIWKISTKIKSRHEKSYKNILIYYIGYMTIKNLILVPTDESKDIVKIMKNYGPKEEILLDQKLITQTIIMKNIWKSI